MRLTSFAMALFFMTVAAIGSEIGAINAPSVLLLCGLAVTWLVDGVCHAIRESKR